MHPLRKLRESGKTRGVATLRGPIFLQYILRSASFIQRLVTS